MASFNPQDLFVIHKPTWKRQQDQLSLSCAYSSGEYSFCEIFEFSFPIDAIDFDESQMDSMVELVAIAAAPSYYKVTRARKISIEFPITSEVQSWASALFDDGLAEFRYRNNFDEEIIPEIACEVRKTNLQPVDSELQTIVIPIGGGKDSITSLEIAKRAGLNVVGFEVGNFNAIEQSAKVAGVQLIRVKRTIDPYLFELNKQGAPNGHVPVTALVSALGCCGAIAVGIDHVGMSNEGSANEQTRSGANHQWSKTSHAEILLANSIISMGVGVNYFSILRGLSELDIFSLFSTLKEFHHIFTSCNGVFKIDEQKRSENWCGRCDKCRFVFLGLSAFCGVKYSSEIFGKNLFDDPKIIDGFFDLFTKEAKPFECVGTLNESATFAKMSIENDEQSKQTLFGQRYIKDIVFDPRTKLRQREVLDNSRIPNVLLETINEWQSIVYKNRVLEEVKDKTIGTLGLGRDTAGIISFLQHCGYKNTIKIVLPEATDGIEEQQSKFGLDQDNIELVDSLDECDLVFVSPGISKYSNQVAELKECATTSLAFWLGINKKLLPSTLFIGVTGTKGKSTVSSMLNHVLPNSVLAGNIGTSVGTIKDTDLINSDYVILEVSSFQSSYIKTPVDIAVITSLFDCHIDWHQTPENYRRDKLKIIKDARITFAYSTLLEDKIFNELKTPTTQIIEFDRGKTLDENNNNFVRTIADYVDEFNVDKHIQAISSFSGLKYRKEIVGNLNGVTVISDVLATAPKAVLLAVDDIAIQYPNATIYLLCGGAYRDVDLSLLANGLNDRKDKVVTIAMPDTGHMIENNLENYFHAHDLADGFNIAYSKATSGDVILLAPGAPSFHRYKDYTHLASEFESLVDQHK